MTEVNLDDLIHAFHIGRDAARVIFSLITGRISPSDLDSGARDDIDGTLRAVGRILDETQHLDLNLNLTWNENRNGIDVLVYDLDTGVFQTWLADVNQCVVAAYISMNPDAPTVLYDYLNERYRVVSWGDFMEELKSSLAKDEITNDDIEFGFCPRR